MLLGRRAPSISTAEPRRRRPRAGIDGARRTREAHRAPVFGQGGTEQRELARALEVQCCSAGQARVGHALELSTIRERAAPELRSEVAEIKAIAPARTWRSRPRRSRCSPHPQRRETSASTAMGFRPSAAPWRRDEIVHRLSVPSFVRRAAGSASSVGSPPSAAPPRLARSAEGAEPGEGEGVGASASRRSSRRPISRR